ncbi:BamA/TamA family outer membrane protein [Flavobacteriaceae bacterium]|uniref:BamA/OMP85 family outer membrane protein n=1 Tax=Candidatus Arcticimaribacter forsetii TaxID=2820661 RepID=UPI00207793E0|nr:POTRA domain-containing protein [Candidatus Arcticimaribacter forsetii]MDB2325644.1 BamA/TamA family outer membrane protein [Flavobacteriaceae bacterium]MDB2329697.1 BamA/TamA family outer membrane protein [Flavobacteriaceae bacterium]MDC0960090.1 BamA/TamA family outer membrane protein [Flavobacteriaceae bacterium]
MLKPLYKNSVLLFIILVFTLGAKTLSAQTNAPTNYNNSKKYTIDSIKVTGLKSYNSKTVISYSGLRKGQVIQVPGEEISSVIQKLWNLELFSDINFYIAEVNGNLLTLEIEIEELPTLSEVKIIGIKNKKAESLIKDTELTKGKKLSESFLTNTKNYIVNKYRKEGYLNTKVTLNTIPDSTAQNVLKMVVNVDRGDRVKIKTIDFEGVKEFSPRILASKLKNTKKKQFYRFWKKSKYIDKDYQEDLTSLIDFYKEKGFRDARIISDTIIEADQSDLAIKLKIEEGSKYYFGDIKYLGNAAYTDRVLASVLGIKKGDTYNGILLKERIADESKPDGNDITNLYQNNGYLFSNINAVEVSAENDTINFEIRVTEGKLASFNKISVVGNDKTNDHVIFRELRTKPGELYSKDKVVRTVRELGQLGFFDAEQINPDFKNVDPNAGTVDIEFGLVESGASQIELQGGYGGGGFIGTLGLSFNNFSMRNIFDKASYRPVPSGDGQSLSLRLQASQFYNTYSFSFSEPWLGGKQPVQFSTSLSRTNQFRYDFFTQRADKSQSFQISSITFGLAKRLRVPDDFFTLSQAVSYQYYNLQNYFTGLFTFGNGESNNIAYTISLSRNNTSVNPIFPTAGSSFVISAKLTPPFSLFSDIDYGNLENLQEFKSLNSDGELVADQAKMDQEKFRWLEFYKVKFNGTWYTQIWDKLILKTQADFGFLGTYNSDRGAIPFERFYLGGDGMANYALDGRETIALRGYENQSLSSRDGSTIYNKFSLELRYPITLKPTASIYALTFLEAGNGYNSFSDFNPFNSKRSAGGGIRIFMPAFGLLGIDFGYGFDGANDGEIGPHGWETHFIIGQQF